MVRPPAERAPAERVLRDALVLLGLTAALWVFHIYGRMLPTAVLAGVWALLSGAIAGSLIWRKRIRRRAFLAVYIAPESPLQRWLRGGWLLALRQLLLAVVLALVLMVALLRISDAAVWIVLIAAAPVLIAVQGALTGMGSAHASAAYLPELSWRLALIVVGVAMVGVLSALAMYRPYPELTAVSLESAVWHLVEQEQARSEAAETILQAAAAKDALRLWLAQQLMPQPGASLTQLLGWLLVVAEEALFVWSHLLVCNAVLIAANARRLRAAAGPAAGSYT